jgi:hypothetical protein
MAEFTGQNLVINWITTAGTIALSGDYRSVSYTPSGKLVNATAGSDAFETYIGTQKDTKVSYRGVMQSAGTATEDALLPNTFGTLIIQPEGTASGKRKYTIPAFAGGGNFNFQYTDVVEISCDFQGSGTPTIAVN